VNSEDSKILDVLIIGAGISGMLMLIKMREVGATVRVVETAEDVGGTWYWNRYPGARLDSESYSYGYSFSKELLDQWDWPEVFPSQPDNMRYLSHVADRFDLRKDIDFKTQAVKATYSESSATWRVESDNGKIYEARFLISATGPLSALQMPNIPGISSFKGDSFHTARWPRDPNGFGGLPYDFAGKRVAVIGTGSSGVQVIQEAAKTAKQLYVFQRTGNWCAPLRNSPISHTGMSDIRKRYADIFALCKTSYGSFIHDAVDKSALEVTDAEREEFLESRYAEAGFGKWVGLYRDTFIDKRANKLVSDFVARKIRARVKDPVIAEKLIPKDHGFGTRRVPLETNFYEAFNQDNVSLISLLDTPIQEVNPGGLRTSAHDFELDTIIYATGFDPVLGALKKIEIRGKDGVLLKDKWSQGPQTYLGVQTAGFPNFFILCGPHSGSSFGNIPRGVEDLVVWMTDFMKHIRQKKIRVVEADRESELAWTQHVYDIGNMTLFNEVPSWFNGKNTNDPNAIKTFMLYAGGGPAYRGKLEQVQAQGYEGFSKS